MQLNVIEPRTIVLKLHFWCKAVSVRTSFLFSRVSKLHKNYFPPYTSSIVIAIHYLLDTHLQFPLGDYLEQVDGATWLNRCNGSPLTLGLRLIK